MQGPAGPFALGQCGISHFMRVLRARESQLVRLRGNDMIERRDVLIASATALAASLIADSRPAAAQSVIAPKMQSGFLDRPGVSPSGNAIFQGRDKDPET